MNRDVIAKTCLWAILPLMFIFSVGVFVRSFRVAWGQRHGSDEQTHVSLMLGIDFQREMIEGLVREFEQANPQIKVDLTWVAGGQYETKLKTLIAADQAPDIIYCGDVWVAYLLPFLYDITPFVQRDAAEIDLDDFYPHIRSACQYQGRYRFMPKSFNISLLYYNKKIFDQAGEPYPNAQWTWEDYVGAAQRLTRRGPNGRVLIWGSQIVTGWWGEWLIHVRQAGGRLFNDDVSRCLLDSPQAIEGMQLYYDKIYKYKISPPVGYGPDNGFASGKLAMELGGHTGMWLTYNGVRGLEWDIEILPKGLRTRVGGEIALDALGISKTSRQPEAAWELIKFMTSKHAIQTQVEQGSLSVRRSVAEEYLFSPSRKMAPANIHAVYDSLEFARPIPQSPDFMELSVDLIQPEIDLMLQNAEDPAQVCRRVARIVNDFIDVLGKQEGTAHEN